MGLRVKLRLAHPAIGEIAFPIDEGGQVVLGRKGGSTGIELNWDPKISRRHARVWVEAGALWIQDLGSRNGTWYDGTRLRYPIRIEPGMQIRVGQTSVRCAEPVSTDPSTITLNGISRDEIFDELELPSIDLSQSLRPSESIVQEVVSTPRPEPRIVLSSEGIADVELDDRDALAAFWTEELLTTGLFVPTESPPTFGTRIRVRLNTPDGAITLNATVVHVVEADMANRFGTPRGVGLQIGRVDEHTSRRIEGYLRGEVPRLSESADIVPEAADLDGVMNLVKRIVACVERDELYRAIDLASDALQSEVDERLQRLEAILDDGARDLPPPKSARVGQARKGLAHTKSILGTVEKRLQFDFAQDRVDSERRLKAAADRTGPDAGTLRRAWRACHPKRVEHAQALLRSAFEMRRTRAYDEALTLGRQALVHDPFWLELRSTVETWDSLYTPGLPRTG